ncbi:hypothetical protein DQ384_19620 [Sphaerisporangium album]|uniref:histidine kinase n=1 Tax=Sphaerisporangium album TaxID=509200 RepID=A0A367FJH4_9ACTN|nr:histidine kinase [Sphaerisporangium album]RCG29780.1 hypothetical protein DQ384_19620 [Sphaerisporangium album]
MRGRWAEFAARHRGEIGDALLAVAVLAFTVPTTLVHRAFSLFFEAPDWLEILAGVITAATMLLRRRTAWPMIVAAIGCAVLTGQAVPLTLAAYSMTSENKVRRWHWAVAVMAAVYVVADYVNPYTDEFLYLAVVRALTLVYLPALVGTWVWEYRDLIGELRAGVRLREEHAASRERRWLAGELHDTVTHAVTSMVLNAGIIREAGDPAEIGELAATVEDKGVQALAELRELLTVLRREDVPRSAAGVDAIPRLVEEASATGMRVSLHFDVPRDVLLPRQVGHTCFRVVQEGLNNVRKHAPGSRVRVTCTVAGEVVNVSVVDTGSGGDGTAHRFPPIQKSGYGLSGLRERVVHAGGELQAGPTLEGGFALTARIPIPAAS